MNYIKSLQLDNASLLQRVIAANECINDFRAHLHSPKFAGKESDGSRKDWIATADVLSYLSNIRDALHGIE